MFARSLAALMLGVTATACGASGDAISLPHETPRDAGVESASTGDEADAAPNGDELPPPAPELDGACNACIDAALSWGEDGELWDETSTLLPCHAYSHTRAAYAGRASASCADEFVACGGGALTPGLLGRALADPYLQTALANDGPIIYGRDSRLVDGTVFRMVINGKEIVLGACAADDEQCVEPGVASLANLLRRIDDELLRRPACAEAFASD
jgi:hypothetical protein